MVTAYDILARAHELLEVGWCQGIAVQDGDDGRAYCTAGALRRARDELGVSNRQQVDLADAALGRVMEQVDSTQIVDWNDTPGRTQAEVLAVVARAAEKARREGEK